MNEQQNGHHTTPRRRPDSRGRLLPPNYKWRRHVPPQMTEEQYVQHVLEKSGAAHQLLADPHFNRVYHELLSEGVDTIIDSKPGEHDLREDNYFAVRGLQDIVMRLQFWMAQADAIRADKPVNTLA